MNKDFCKASKKLLTNFSSALSRIDPKIPLVSLMMMTACASPAEWERSRPRRAVPPEARLEVDELYYLRDTVRDLNRDHDRPSDVRFQALSSISPKALLRLTSMDYTTEYYPSTALKLLNNLDRELSQSPASVSSLIDMDMKYRPISAMGLVRLATRFGKFGDLSASLQTNTFQNLLRTYLTFFDSANFHLSIDTPDFEVLGYMLDIAEQVGLKGSEENKKSFLNLMTELYDDPKGRENNPSRKFLNIALSKFFSADLALEEKGRAYELSKLYPVPPSPALETDSLFQNGLHVSTVSFYGDTDGKNHFGYFVNELKRSNEWSLTDEGSFLKAQSVPSSHNNKKILILLTKPSVDQKPFEDIKAYLETHHLYQNSHMERGHSYRMNTEHILKTEKPLVVIWGGCNSYYGTKSILQSAPMAFVISTRQTGIGDANNKLYFAFLKNIMEDTLFNSNKIWETAQKQGASLAQYLKPEENRVSNAYKILSLTP